MKIVVLGAAGSGKGTQCEMLAKALKIPTISTGDLFRDNIKNKTPIGEKAESYVSKGIPVPDDIGAVMLRERLKNSDCKKGFILDGYPRSLSQAKILQNITTIDHVIVLKASREVLLHRISGRRMCASCKYTSHVNSLNGSTICPNCGGEMTQRKDDKDKAAIENRLNTMFFNVIEPILEFYKKQGILHEVPAEAGKNEIYKEISQVLGI